SRVNFSDHSRIVIACASLIDASRNIGLSAMPSARGVEARRQLLERLFPPPGNEPPAHRHKLGYAAIGRPHHVHGVGRGDVVVGLEIAGGAREAVKVVNFAPRVALCEASAHIDSLPWSDVRFFSGHDLRNDFRLGRYDRRNDLRLGRYDLRNAFRLSRDDRRNDLRLSRYDRRNDLRPSRYDVRNDHAPRSEGWPA